MQPDADSSLVRALKDNVAAKQQQIDYLADQVDEREVAMRHQRSLNARLLRMQATYIHNIAGSYSEN